MIQTFKDAELQIQALKREIETLKKELRLVRDNGNETAPLEQVVVEKAIDSELTADGGTVNHKLLHLFKNLKTENLDVEGIFNSDKIDIRADPADINWRLHISGAPNEQGFYISNIDGNSALLSQGIKLEGNQWITVNIKSVIFQMVEDYIKIFLNTHSVGSSVDVNAGLRYELHSDGQFHITNNGTDEGTWIINNGPSTSISNNAKLVGGSWVATGGGNPLLISLSSGGSDIAIYSAPGTSGGSTISWTPICAFSLANGISFFQETAKNGTRTSLSVYSKAEVDSLLNNKANHGIYAVSGGAGGTVSI